MHRPGGWPGIVGEDGAGVVRGTGERGSGPCARWCRGTVEGRGLPGVFGPESRVDADRDLTGSPGPVRAGGDLVDEPPGPSGGVGRAFAPPGVIDLAGIGSKCQGRARPEFLPGRSCALLTLHLGDR